MAENANPSILPASEDDEGSLARRRLVIGGAALAGSAIATLATAKPAAAGHNTAVAYDTETVMHVDVTNTTVGSTRISSNISGTAAFVANNNYPVGISRPDGILGRTAYTTSNCAGVAGASQSATGGIGVMGASAAADGVGVYGFAGSVVPSTVAPAGTGVYASGPVNGVYAVARDAEGTAGLFEGKVQAERLTLTRTAGRAKVPRAAKSMTVKNVPVDETSIVVATLQQPKPGLYVTAVVPGPVGNKFKIHFNKKAPKGTLVGWILVN